MVLDSSALLVLLNDEPEAEAFRGAVENDPVRLTSTASLVEASIVIESRLGEIGGRELDLLIRKAGIRVVPVDEDQALVARRAFRRFGKGRHSAALNFGDVFSYALSKSSGEPLLFKGTDFSRTDIEQVALED
jgi:ribonuclease VapC